MTATPPMARYRTLPTDRPADSLEQELLARWTEEDLFRQSLAAREGAEEFVFLEGPPTANGRPGIHHVFARTVKDLFCRHRAMKGFHVSRKAGWDTHGLPVEIEVEKQLGISGKAEIEKIGVERFNQLCRENVWKYKAEWQKLSERIAFWLDYENAYATYSNDYVESVWWALKTLHERGLLMRGHKILPYCPRCGTALSSHEVAQGYQDVDDPSLFVALDLTEVGGQPVATMPEGADGSAAGASSGSRLGQGRTARRILVWTTTPWTLVSNVALAINPELTYVELRRKGSADQRTIILAADRAAGVLGDDYTDRWDTVARLTGATLVGARYRRPLDWVALGDGAHEIVVGESFVSAADGTGVVHMAPAFGADDYAAGQRHGLAFVQPLNPRGEFGAEVPRVGGQFVKAADAGIIEELRERGVMWKAGTLEHSYPHCWRCGTPLLYMARGSWFVRTTAIKDQMLARNARVDWHPEEMGVGRFGDWLVNNIDWAISRDRFWGTPLPVWVCDASDAHVDVVGSYAELAERVGSPLGESFDPHKPFIDRHSWACQAKGCAGTMHRVPEVIDAWFDSGSMPFAQWHFPFENADQFKRHYPGDFIAEGVDQTRGWFYSLLAIATGLGDALPGNAVSGGTASGPGGAAPYRSVVVNDLVLDAEGQKMSKSRGNAVDPWAVLERHGADAVRLFLVASSQVWIPRRFDEQSIRDTAGRFLLTLKNVYSGIFALYANFGWAPSPADPPLAQRSDLDRWVLSRLAHVESAVDGLLERYEATAAARLLMEFVVDDLSNWYVRLSRDRFYSVDGEDNRAAFATLHEALVIVTRLLAPFSPFVSDWIHRELTGVSVHLAPFGRSQAKGVRGTEGEGDRFVGGHMEPALERAMGAIRTLATLGRAARETAGIRVRQPLARMVCVVPIASDGMLAMLTPLLEAELNVKRVEFLSSADALVTLEAKANFRTLGKKFGKDTKLAAEAVSALTGEALRKFEAGEPLAIAVGNESRILDAEDIAIVRRASGDLVVQEASGYFAAIDPAVTPELRREGLVRELISRVQRMRKESGLAVSDRVRLTVVGNQEVLEALRAHNEALAGEVLAREVRLIDGNGNSTGHDDVGQAVDLDGIDVRVAISKVD